MKPLAGLATQLKPNSRTTPPPRAVDPLRALADRLRLRWSLDACGDYTVPGRYGEISWHSSVRDGLPDRIGVQVGGPRADGSLTAVPVGSNFRVNRLVERWGAPSTGMH